jgi:RNA polymerase sigma factor (sigma-70 family)
MAVSVGSSILPRSRLVVADWRDDPRTDVELLDRFVHLRDEKAFATLVGRHGELVWGVCLRILRNQTDAEDALQSTFLRLARDAGRIQNGDALTGWVIRAARDSAIDMQRAIRRQRRIEERFADAMKHSEGSPLPMDFQPLLDDALSTLSHSERAVMVLVCLEGRTYSDTALNLGCSVAAVHRRFLRAQIRLRGILARRGPERKKRSHG